MKVCRTIEPGVYRHFKGGEYEVVGLARHSETEEELVVYRALYGDGGLWVRPSEMFLSAVDRRKYPDSKQVYRFERIYDGDDSASCHDSCENSSSGRSIFAKPDSMSIRHEVGGRAGLDNAGDFCRDELAEAKRQIGSLLNKLESSLKTLMPKDDPSRYKSQVAWTKRRIEALRIARRLIEREMG